MEKLIIEMEKYRRDHLVMTEKELAELQGISNEVDILLKHSGEKITMSKEAFSTYFNLITLYKNIEGFNHAINYVDSYNKENKE